MAQANDLAQAAGVSGPIGGKEQFRAPPAPSTPHPEKAPFPDGSGTPAIEAPNERRFCDILADARHYRLPGAWSGSAFRSHPCGVVRNGIIFANAWNTNNYCHAEVLLDPTSPIKPGMNAPAAYGDPYPHPERGGTLRVYWTGSWSGDDGPWRKIIVDTLAELVAEIEVAKAAKAERDRLEAEAAQAAHAARVRQAAAALSIATGGQHV